MVRDYASTAHVYASDELRRPCVWGLPVGPVRVANDAAGQVGLPVRRFSPMAHAYRAGFGDAA